MLYPSARTSPKACDQSSWSESWPGIKYLNQLTTAGPTATPQMGASEVSSSAKAFRRGSIVVVDAAPLRACRIEPSDLSVPKAPSELLRTSTHVGSASPSLARQ